MLSNLAKAPFPYYGGKADAADAVWTALGDPVHYVEPFAGSLAVLLRRPALANRAYHSETVCDVDGLLVNAFRGIQLQPQATAEAASWPVCEADLHARHLALVRWREAHNLERLMADPAWCDPVMAGWWIWGCCCWIGGGWCSGQGPWVVGADGIIVRRSKPEPGVNRTLPHVSNDGRGVNAQTAREPGVAYTGPDWWHDDFHPMTMPEIRRWFDFLSARLRHVRILNGDWQRAVTTGATCTIGVRQNNGVAGVFLDPPYSAEQDRCDNIYSHDDLQVATAVREWVVGQFDLHGIATSIAT